MSSLDELRLGEYGRLSSLDDSGPSSTSIQNKNIQFKFFAFLLLLQKIKKAFNSPIFVGSFGKGFVYARCDGIGGTLRYGECEWRF